MEKRKKKKKEFASSRGFERDRIRKGALRGTVFHRGKIHEDGPVFSTKTDYLLLPLACIDSAYGEERFDQLVSVARCIYGLWLGFDDRLCVLSFLKFSETFFFCITIDGTGSDYNWIIIVYCWIMHELLKFLEIYFNNHLKINLWIFENLKISSDKILLKLMNYFNCFSFR